MRPMLRHLKWLTILSLDAPLVALAWQALFAKTHQGSPSWEQRVILFAAVWLGYAADRWLDARREARPSTERHRWHRRHSPLLVGVWAAILAGAVALSFWHLSAPDLAHGFGLVGATLVYTVFAQKGHSMRQYGAMKSLFVGALVAASASLFVFDWSMRDAPEYLRPIALSGAVFTLNSLYIRKWDGELERPSATLAMAWTATLLLAVHIAVALPQQRLICYAAVLAMLGLKALDASRDSLSPSTRRTLADVVLVAPAILLFWP